MGGRSGRRGVRARGQTLLTDLLRAFSMGTLAWLVLCRPDVTTMHVGLIVAVEPPQHLGEVVPGAKRERVVVAEDGGRVIDDAAQGLLCRVPAIMRPGLQSRPRRSSIMSWLDVLG